MTVGRKACSQNRSDNAFTCVTPLLVYKKHTLSDNHQICKQKHWGFSFPATMHLRWLFSVRRIRRRGWATATGRDTTPCFPLPFLRCNALSAFSPPLCRQIPLVFCEPSFQGSDHLFWSPLPYFTQMHFFACAGPARSLREKCNLISQFWTCWIEIFWNRCSLTHTKSRTSNDSPTGQIWKPSEVICKYIKIYYDSGWEHLRQPCANLAPSLCFAGFPCVTPHNENDKSYTCVGCDTPSLKFEYRTFDRLSYV